MRRFTVIDAPQRSPEWFQARLGRITGSRAADMLATIKSGAFAASRRNLCLQLVLERLTGEPQENGYVSKAMQDGIEREPAALALYDAVSGNVSVPSGFLAMNDIAAGCSLDGYVGDFEGIVEAKSPIPATHLDYIRGGIPSDYMRQIVHNLWVSGAQWCDWLSYNPTFPESMQLRLIRVDRDEKVIEDYEKQVKAFLAEVDREEAAIRTMANPSDVLAQVTA